jgi:hypothetical protein
VARLRSLEFGDGGLEPGEALLQFRLPAAQIEQVRGLVLDLIRHVVLLGLDSVDRRLQRGRIRPHAVQVRLERWIHGIQ